MAQADGTAQEHHRSNGPGRKGRETVSGVIGESASNVVETQTVLFVCRSQQFLSVIQRTFHVVVVLLILTHDVEATATSIAVPTRL